MNQTDKKKLLRYIQEVAFAIDDVVLYLDTHPYDEEALKYYKKYKKLYHEASEEYTQCYGPLDLGGRPVAMGRSMLINVER